MNSSDLLYQCVRGVVRFWLWFFFRRVEVKHAERVPLGGPVLLAINHPNNLIDTLLVGAVIPRKVHYLATATLFRNPLLARFLSGTGVIPIHRRQDQPTGEVEEEKPSGLTPPEKTLDRNTGAFEACHRVFERGGVIGIYPEGTTHAEPRVQRIKTGAARIALECEARHDGQLHLRLIPVGLSFEFRKSFRGRVRVSFGESIPLDPFLAMYRESPWKAVDQLTTAIQEAMEAHVIHVSRMGLARLIKDVEEIFRSALIKQLIEERKLSRNEIDTFRLSRTVVEAVHYFHEHDPERVQEIAAKIEHYKDELARLKLRDTAIARGPSRGRALDTGGVKGPGARAMIRNLSLTGMGVFGFPVFAYGALTNGLPYLVPRWLSHRLARKETDYATTRLLASVVAFPVFYALEIYVVWRWLGSVAAMLFALSLPATGLVAYRYLHGVGRLRQRLTVFRQALAQRQALSQLIAERQLILSTLEQAKNDFLKSTRGA